MTNTEPRWVREDKLRERLPELANEVAKHMGDGWEANPKYRHLVYVLGPDGEGIALTTEGPDRIRAFGTFPSGPSTYDLEGGEITVAVSRGAEALAKEIQRRLLPKYLPALAVAKQRKAEQEARDKYQTHVLDQVRKILGINGAQPYHWEPGNVAYISRYGQHYAHTTVEVMPSGNVRITVESTLDELLPVLNELVSLPSGGDWR